MIRSRRSRGLLAVASLALLPACQSGPCLDASTMRCSPIEPTPTPARPPERLDQGSGSLPRDGVAVAIVRSSNDGAISVAVDWTFASNTVEVHVARGSCVTDAFEAGRCEVLGASTNPAAKPKRLVIAPAPAGVYTILVRNLGPGDESFAFDVSLSR